MGGDKQQGAMFSYVKMEQRIPADQPIRLARAMAHEPRCGNEWRVFGHGFRAGPSVDRPGAAASLSFYCLPNRKTTPPVKPTLFCMVDPNPVTKSLTPNRSAMTGLTLYSPSRAPVTA
jgi:hypothetical protein